MAPLELPRLTVTGTPRELGRGQGEHWRELVQGFTRERLRAARVNLWESGVRDLDRLLAVGRDALGILAAWHPDGHQEHTGLAEAALVDPVELYVATNLTDLRDVVLYGTAGAAPADAEGCTAVLVPPARSADGRLIAAQTWDLNPGDLDYVVAVERRPSEGPATWSVTCAGASTLVALNEHGVAVGTTNIKVREVGRGVGYLSLLHAAAGHSDHRAAAAAIADAPRAAAHTFWCADGDGALLLTATGASLHRETLGDEGLCQTNHVRQPGLARLEAEPPSPSSLARLERGRACLCRSDLDQLALRTVFADRSRGVDSINRYPEDGTGTATNSCFIAVPAAGRAWACRGPADRGEWVELGF